MSHKRRDGEPAAARRDARPGRGRGRDARRASATGRSPTSSCGSTSRRGSSRRFLRGRAYTEPPDITARICGICPVAYQMSACLAIEDACGVTRARGDPADAPAALLRRVDREPRAARLPAARPGLPGLRRRHRDGRGPPRGGRARAAAEEGRQRPDDAGRAAARCTRSTSRSAASTGCPTSAELQRPAPAARAGTGRRARDRHAWSPASTSRTSSSPTSTSSLRTEHGLPDRGRARS